MPRLIKVLIAIAATALVAFLVVFGLAKAKVIFINEWFVDRSASVIGVDVSAYQGEVDMGKLREQGVAFMYIKATEGSSHVDERFAANWQAARDADLPAGAYHFFSYDSPGKTQADNFVNVMGTDLSGRLVPAVGVEYYGDKEQNPPNKDDVVRELRDFLDSVEGSCGVRPMIYTRPDVYDKYLAGTFDGYKIWMSSLYSPIDWNYHGDWYIWQYLNRGVLEGYNGDERFIDLDVLNRNRSVSDLLVE
jgi:lysozyme